MHGTIQRPYPTSTDQSICHCDQYYFGDRCQFLTVCSSFPCLNNGICSQKYISVIQRDGYSYDGKAYYYCQCQNGYYGHRCQRGEYINGIILNRGISLHTRTVLSINKALRSKHYPI